MERILVPLDGSDVAEHALEPAIGLAGRHKASLHLVSVVPELSSIPILAPDGNVTSHPFEGHEDRAASYLEGLSKRVSLPADVEARTHVRTGGVVPTLLDLMEEVDADLVALTTHGRGAWARIWLGSVADQLLRSTDRPLLVLKPRPPSEPTFTDVGYPASCLIPVDGSKGAELVFETVETLLPESGGRLILATVLHIPIPFASAYLPETVTPQDVIEQQRQRMERYLAEIAERLSSTVAASVDTSVLVDDHPARSLLRLAESESVDLIALSTHGRSPAGRLILGSVADKLIRGAEVPVLTVPRRV